MSTSTIRLKTLPYFRAKLTIQLQPKYFDLLGWRQKAGTFTPRIHNLTKVI